MTQLLLSFPIEKKNTTYQERTFGELPALHITGAHVGFSEGRDPNFRKGPI